MYCYNCGRACQGKLIDAGTLPTQQDLVTVSVCCESEVVDSLWALEPDTCIQLVETLLKENADLRADNTVRGMQVTELRAEVMKLEWDFQRIIGFHPSVLLTM